MERITITKKFNVKKQYDIIVCGGGVAGVAAAVTAGRAFPVLREIVNSCFHVGEDFLKIDDHFLLFSFSSGTSYMNITGVSRPTMGFRFFGETFRRS